jgi:aryl sulfotransferase
MKQQGELYTPGGGQFWKEGAKTFLHKGTNGRWRDVLSAEELTLYDTACDKALTGECRQWLEHGGQS